MYLYLAVILSAYLSTSAIAQTPADMQSTTETKKEMTTTTKKKKVAEKTVKTNGEISTSGCETVDGKKLNEGEAGYHDCLRQIGTKKK